MDSIDLFSMTGFPTEAEETETLEITGTELTARVILYNDEHHTFDEVIFQIIKATQCSFDRAEALTWEVHSRGLSNVFEGDFMKCLQVSGILEQIDLRTNIEC
jgi:ATP-dependent Clp protease adapter protein ClpS